MIPKWTLGLLAVGVVTQQSVNYAKETKKEKDGLLMPEESPDYEVADGLPEDQEEEDESRELILQCQCGSTLEIIVGTRHDIKVVAAASRWIANPLNTGASICPRCQ